MRKLYEIIEEKILAKHRSKDGIPMPDIVRTSVEIIKGFEEVNGTKAAIEIFRPIVKMAIQEELANPMGRTEIVEMFQSIMDEIRDPEEDMLLN